MKGIVLSILSVLLFSGLARTAVKPDQANWDNLKQLAPGQEVKIVLNDAKAYRGVFESVTTDGIGVALQTGKATFARQDILRVSTKTQGHRLRNTLLGTAIGGAAGAGVAASGDNSGSAFGSGGAVALGLIGGSALGAVVGAVMPAGGWRDVYRAR